MYADFLLTLRESQGYTLRQVSEGVCSESGLNRFEKGDRVVEKLVNDRITERLGVSCDRFEDYLQPREYERWEHRQHIVRAIDREKLQDAKLELDAYESSHKLNGLNCQFVAAMRYMILKLEGASEEELRDSIQKVVKITVPNIERHFATGCLLSAQEIVLILEQMSLELPGPEVEDVHAWRILEYEKLITYVENSCWEKTQVAKVYPRIVYYICKEAQSVIDADEARRMGNFAYLYYENLCHNVAEIIEIRRKSLGLSRARLSAGICTEKTISRIEHQEVNPTIDMMRRLFEGLGMYPDYRHVTDGELPDED